MDPIELITELVKRGFTVKFDYNKELKKTIIEVITVKSGAIIKITEIVDNDEFINNHLIMCKHKLDRHLGV